VSLFVPKAICGPDAADVPTVKSSCPPPGITVIGRLFDDGFRGVDPQDHPQPMRA